MKDESTPRAAHRQYRLAHEMHYTTKDLYQALELYKRVITAYPDTQEAAWSRMQIEYILDNVVPNQDLLNGGAEPASSHSEYDESDPDNDDPDPECEECPKLRQRRDDLDSAWDKRKHERKEAETNRRVKEQWRGPY